MLRYNIRVAFIATAFATVFFQIPVTTHILDVKNLDSCYFGLLNIWFAHYNDIPQMLPHSVHRYYLDIGVFFPNPCDDVNSRREKS